MNQYQKILSLVIATSIFTYALTFQSIYAQTHTVHSDTDSTPVAAVIMITKDKDGNTIFNPSITTIKQDEEILILNNDTVGHSFTNGANPEDPMAGKMFDSGTIQPKGFIEYVAANLSPGNYTFYSTTDPTVTAQISILEK
ncbi:MAG: cupredoxin domain-containing protein [Nitrososphaeraceae archaeon]